MSIPSNPKYLSETSFSSPAHLIISSFSSDISIIFGISADSWAFTREIEVQILLTILAVHSNRYIHHEMNLPHKFTIHATSLQDYSPSWHYLQRTASDIYVETVQYSAPDKKMIRDSGLYLALQARIVTIFLLTSQFFSSSYIMCSYCIALHSSMTHWLVRIFSPSSQGFLWQS